jgi:hypothetical protein
MKKSYFNSHPRVNLKWIYWLLMDQIWIY